MQNKRFKPEIFLNDEVDVDEEIVGNQFNQILKESLMNKSQERVAANKREQRLNHMDSSLLLKKAKLRNNRNLSLPFEGDSSISCRRSIEIGDTKTDQTSIEET